MTDLDHYSSFFVILSRELRMTDLEHSSFFVILSRELRMTDLDHSSSFFVILSRELRMTDLDRVLPNGELKHKVPRSTMQRWAKDDHEVMAAKGMQGGWKGEPHWKVEQFVRGRTELTRAGKPARADRETYSL